MPEAWRHRTHRGRTYEHARFADFITAKPIEGCGCTLDRVEALLKDDAKTLTLWRKATVPQGSHRSNPEGKAYTLSRLERERPDLFEKVDAGELSANAAAIKLAFQVADSVRAYLPPFAQTHQ